MILGLFCFVGFSNNKYNPDTGLKKSVQKETLNQLSVFVEKETICINAEIFDLKVKIFNVDSKRIYSKQIQPGLFKEQPTVANFNILYLLPLSNRINYNDKINNDVGWSKNKDYIKYLNSPKNTLKPLSEFDPGAIEVYFDWPKFKENLPLLLQS